MARNEGLTEFESMNDGNPVDSDSMKTHERITAHLRRRIVTGELAVGERLPSEDELTKIFGIARSTLREALRVLEAQGLVEIRRGRGGGPVVTEPSLELAANALAISLQLQGATVGDMVAVRGVLEPHAASELAKGHSDEDIAALSAAIDRAHEAAEANDTAAFGEAAVLVHETVLERAGNPTLSTLSRMLHDLVLRYYADRAATTDQKRMRRAVRSYRRLVDLIIQGSVEEAHSHWEKQIFFTAAPDFNEQLDIY